MPIRSRCQSSDFYAPARPPVRPCGRCVVKGLKEGGFVDGDNVTVDYRWANDQTDRLPALAAALVERPVAVLVAGASAASLAAKNATSTIPIMFIIAADPVKFGLVARLKNAVGRFDARP